MIPADGIRQSVPWRLRHEASADAFFDDAVAALLQTPRFEAEDVEALDSVVASRMGPHDQWTALTPEQIRQIVRECGTYVEEQDIIELARDLAQDLNPTLRPFEDPLPRELAVQRARRAMLATQNKLMRAAELMTRGIEELDGLDTRLATDREGAERFERFREEYDAVLRAVEGLHRKLGFLKEAPDVALDLRPADRKRIPDGRRRIVLFRLFRFWRDKGHKLTYSTLPEFSSSRAGPLVNFVNTVVRCLTDPSEDLSGDTIRGELEAFLAEHDHQS